jgi:hypothetical protein
MGAACCAPTNRRDHALEPAHRAPSAGRMELTSRHCLLEWVGEHLFLSLRDDAPPFQCRTQFCQSESGLAFISGINFINHWIDFLGCNVLARHVFEFDGVQY